MNACPFHLHIEELVLHGFPAAERHRVADAVQRELANWLSEQSRVPRRPATIRVDGIDAGEFVASRSGATIGRQIARSVGGAITGAMAGPEKPRGGPPC